MEVKKEGVPNTTIKTIFIKYGDTAKKINLQDSPISSIQDIRDLFASKFSGPTSLNTSATRKDIFQTSTIFIQHPTSRTFYALEDLSDLYSLCILEIHSNLTSSSIKDHPHTLHHTHSSSSLLKLKNNKRINNYYGLQRDKLVFVTVGLPARGKTFLARKIARYMNWLGVPTRVFNVGNYRRQRLGAKQKPEFFDPDNKEGVNARLHMAVLAMDDMFDWLSKGGIVAIYDATNSTLERRRLITTRASDENVKVIFVESICESQQIIAENLKETKLRSPDFEGISPDVALTQFFHRIENYKRSYVTLSDDELVPYIKLFDVGSKIIINKLPNSYLPGRVVFFLMNLHIVNRKIWLTRHGQSQDNLLSRLGGDSPLTPAGESYARRLSEFLNTRLGLGQPSTGSGLASNNNTNSANNNNNNNNNNSNANNNNNNTALNIWTSTMQRSIMTAAYMSRRKVHLRALDEIDAGTCEGMSYEEVAEAMPEEYEARASDKLRYRYPGGESYEDVILRLEPVIFEVERQREPIVIIAHNAVIRCLYGYLMDKKPEECPHIEVPLHTVIELTPRAYGCDEERFSLLSGDEGPDHG